MRILAVAQRLNLVEAQEELFGQAGLTAHVFGDMTVIEGRMGVGLGREAQTRLGECVAVGGDLVEDHRVVGGFADHGDALAVFRRRAEHRGSAYVDVLDGVCQSHVGLGHRGLERIEVDAYQIDQTYAVLLELSHVVVIVTTAQQGAVHLGVERLHAAAADLGESGDVADAGHLQTAVAEHLHCSAGGDDFPAHFLEGACEVHDSCLVAYAD